jgi:hypothetical protein
MSADTVRDAISTDTKSFLSTLPEPQLRMLLNDHLHRDFTQNFFDVSQLKMTYMYLPIKKVRTMTNLSDSVSDEEVMKEVKDKFLQYTSQLFILLSELTVAEQKEFIAQIPYVTLQRVIKTNGDFSIDYIKNVLVNMDDDVLRQLSRENYFDGTNDMVWCGIR